MKNRIFLIGFMGAGKTVVGEKLAKQLDWHWVDLDALVVQMAGLTINEIFMHYGEAHFRQLEKEALKSVATRENLVISTGGGIVLDEANRAVLKFQGNSIYLKASLETLQKRLLGTQDRPLLQIKSLESLLSQREAFYTAVSDQIMMTDALSVDEVVARLLEVTLK